MESNALYFSRRAAEERIAAMKADNQNARRAHLELADRYGDLADAFRLTGTWNAGSNRSPLETDARHALIDEK
jgi:hypothetical protein